MAVPRLRTVVTLAILTVTVQTAVTGYLAGKASGAAGGADASRQAHEIAAGQQAIDVEGKVANSLEISADSLDALARRIALGGLALTPGLPADVVTDLRKQHESWAVIGSEDDRLNPGGVAGVNVLRVTAGRAGAREHQLAELAVAVGAAWVARDNTYVAAIGVLAVTLFLLGLALVVHRRAIAWGFVVVGATLALSSAGFTLDAFRQAVPVMSDASLNAYLDGLTANARGDQAVARQEFTTAVAGRPDYAAAWRELGNLNNSPAASTAARAGAVADYQKAVAYGDTSPFTYSLLAFAEFRLKRLNAALADAQLASSLAPQSAVNRMLLAIIEAQTGSPAAAGRETERAIALAGGLSATDRNVYFSRLRSFPILLADVGISEAKLTGLFDRVKEAEASYGAVGRPQPGPLGGAHIADLRVVNANLHTSQVKFTYDHFARGRILSLRWYDASGEYQRLASKPAIAWPFGTDGPFVYTVGNDQDLLADGTYTIEVYLDGNHLGQTQFTLKSSL